MNRTYYDILEVQRTATAQEIRKSYLRLSLKHHPDKNPNGSEEAKAKFIEIGAAYETLSDPVKRRMYDQELRSGQRPAGDGFSSGFNGCSDGFSSHSFNEQQYNSYRDFFDETVASMSEEELAAAVGAVTMLASVVGGIVGSRLLSGGCRKGAADAARGGAGSSALGVAGSMIGSVLASELASSGVRALHQESLQRIAYKEECRRAVERGESVPNRPRSGGLGKFFKQTVENVLNGAQNNNNHPGADSNQSGAVGLDDVWRMAAEGLRAAAAAQESRTQYSR